MKKKFIDHNHNKYITTPENGLKKLQIFDSICFRSESRFKEDGTQNYLVFQPIYRYCKRVAGSGSGNYIYFWKSNEKYDENITAPTTTDYSVNPQLSCFGTKTRVEFKGKQIKIAYDHRKEVNNYIVYEIVSLYEIYACDISSCPALENCLFGSVALTKNVDLDKYMYLGCGIGFVRKGFFYILLVELAEM